MGSCSLKDLWSPYILRRNHYSATKINFRKHVFLLLLGVRNVQKASSRVLNCAKFHCGFVRYSRTASKQTTRTGIYINFWWVYFCSCNCNNESTTRFFHRNNFIRTRTLNLPRKKEQKKNNLTFKDIMSMLWICRMI